MYRVYMADRRDGKILKAMASPFLYKSDAEGYVDYCRKELAEAAELLQGSGRAYTEPDEVEFLIVGE